jgi:hypothetical protein
MISAIHIKLDVHKLILYENCVDTYGNKSALGDGYPYSTHSFYYMIHRLENNKQGMTQLDHIKHNFRKLQQLGPHG